MSKILVIDDDSSSRRLMTGLLEGLSHAVVAAADGRQGLELARRERPDLVICDMMMPTMSGVEFVQQLSLEAGLARPPVAFWTSSYQEDDAMRMAAECGAALVLQKAQPVTELLAAIEALLGTLAAPSGGLVEALAQAPLPSPGNLMAHAAADAAYSRLLNFVEMAGEAPAGQDLPGALAGLCRLARSLQQCGMAGIGLVDVSPPLIVTAGPDLVPASLREQLQPGGFLAELAAAGRTFRGTLSEGAVSGSSSGLGPFLGHSFLAVPMTRSGRAIGLLWFAGKSPAPAFTADDEVLARLLAAQLTSVRETFRIEASARTAEARFRSLAEQLPAVSVLVALGDNAEVLYVSSQVETMLGYTPAQWCRPPLWPSLLHPDERDSVYGEVGRLTSPGDEAVLEYRLRRQDGTWLWVRDHARVIGTMPDGRPLLQGIFVDIGRTKLAELRLSVQHSVALTLASAPDRGEGLRRVLDTLVSGLGAACAGYWCLEEAGTDLQCRDFRLRREASPELQNLETVSRGSSFARGLGLPGAVWQSLEPVVMRNAPLDPRFVRAGAVAAAGLQEAVGFPVSCGDQFEGVIDLLFPGRCEADPELLETLSALGRQVGQYFGQKRAEEELVERCLLTALTAEVSAALAAGGTLRQVLAACCEAVVHNLGAAFARVWTLDADKQVLELQASAGLYTHLDGAHARVKVGALKIGLIASERKPHFTNSVLTDERVSDPEWARREGMVSFAGHPLLAEDRLVGVMAMFSRKPLTGTAVRALASVARSVAVGIERIRARSALEASEARLRQSQKMEAFGQLAGGVAHDFNNLLTVISGHAGFILSDTEPGSDSHSDAQVISETAEKAAGLTRQLLAFSRKQVLQPRMLDLNAVVSEAQKMLRRLIGEDITVTVMLAGELQKVSVDPGQMDQVLLNLVVNARDAMPQGGCVTIETANVELGPESASLELEPGSYVELTVADTGVGMDEPTRLRIFEPFFTTKEHGRGTGLGLATVDGVVRQSRGAIRVQSAPGQGSRFTVLLPASRPELTAAAHAGAGAAVAGATSGDRKTILVVDDEDAVREVLCRLLRRLGFEVLEAGLGARALELGRRLQGTVHLLVCDVVMPGMNGVDLAMHFTQLHPETQVLFISGYPDDERIRRGIDSRRRHFLPKPIVGETLARKVREILGETGTSAAVGTPVAGS